MEKVETGKVLQGNAEVILRRILLQVFVVFRPVVARFRERGGLCFFYAGVREGIVVVKHDQAGGMVGVFLVAELAEEIDEPGGVPGEVDTVC